MSSFTPADIVLCIVVISFWAVLIIVARGKSRPLSITVLILPTFFILLGMTINRYYPMIGTYTICIIHVMLLVPLWRIANVKR